MSVLLSTLRPSRSRRRGGCSPKHRRWVHGQPSARWMMRFAAFGFALMAAWLLASLGGNALGQAPAASSASVESVSPDLAPLVVRDEDLELLLEEDFIDEKQLNEFCKKLLEKLNIPFDVANNIATLLPCTNKETIETLTKETAWIRWSGVLGLYKMQKQSIIKDVENLLGSQESGAKSQDDNSTIEPVYFDGEVLSPVTLDPSQENVLQQLKQNNALIIQGPPGTGKSQSLTASITQALLNKQKVLVVCE